MSYKKMNPKYKKSWVEALESGKFRQGMGNLKVYDNNAKRSKYCCLGVLCEINKVKAVKETHGVTWFDDEEMNLSPDLQKKFGITAAVHGHLIDMNDGKYDEKLNQDITYSFKQIASWIRKNL